MINMFLGCVFGGAISAACFGSVTTQPVRKMAVWSGLAVMAFGLAGTFIYIAVTI